jgi:hypothetical protein
MVTRNLPDEISAKAAGDDSRLSDARTPTDGSVSTVKIVDGAVTDAKLASKKAPRTALWLPGTSGNYVSAPDSPGFAIGNLDVRLWFSPDDWSPASQSPIGQWNSTGNQRGWQVLIDTSGRFSVIWSTDGTYNPGVTYFSQQVSTGNSFTDGTWKGVRVLLDVDNGASGRDLSVYHRADSDIESDTGWTQLGSTSTAAGTTSIHNSTANLDVGAVALGGWTPGRYGKAVLLNGIDGTVVASPDFSAPMGPRLRDAQGNIWTINGSAWAWEVTA